MLISKEGAQIVQINIDTEDGITGWSITRSVRVVSPGHKDHDKLGLIVGFEFLERADGGGWIFPQVRLRGSGNKIHVIPFEKLRITDELFT